MIRVLFFLCLMVGMAMAETATFNFHADHGQGVIGGYVRFYNPSGASVTIYPSDGTQTLTAAATGWPHNINWSWRTPAVVTIPAGGQHLQQMQWVFARTGVVDYRAFTVPTSARWNHGGFGGTQKSATVEFSIVLNRALGTSNDITPAGVVLAEVAVADPPPSGVIRITAGAGATGERTLNIGTAITQTINVAAGTNTVWTTATPADVPDGTAVSVKLGDEVVGTGTIAKDAFGNFSLTISVNPPTAKGLVIVNGAYALEGEGQLISDTISVVRPFTFDGTTSERTRYEVDPGSLTPTGSVWKAQWKLPGSNPALWSTVGEGAVQAAPNGSWVLIINCRGREDPPPNGPDDGVFELDLVSYDVGSKAVQLEVGGVIFTPTNSNTGGDPEDGQRKKYRIVVDNSDGRYFGKDYRWIVSGQLGNEAVTGVTIANGRVPPAPLVTPATEGIPSNQFEVSQSVTLGSPYVPPTVGEEEMPPPEEYNPDEPPPPGETPEQAAAREEKKDNYEATRKAMEDALKSTLGGGTGPGSMEGAPKSGEGTAMGGKAGEIAGGIADGAKGIEQALSVPQPISWTGATSSVTLNLPVYGPATLNLAWFDPWPAIIRVLILAWWAWTASMVALRMIKQAIV